MRLTAVILGGGRGTRLYPLTKLRSKPAVPIGGKFRLIDIPISNCLHSDVRKIFILTQFNTESLHRHITRTYQFDNFSKGFVRILAAQQTDEIQEWYQGTADAVRKNLRFLHSADDHIIILSGDHLYRMDYRKFFDYHLTTGADISIAVKPIEEHQAKGLGILKANSEGEITEFIEKPEDSEILQNFKAEPEIFRLFDIHQGSRTHLASMGIYIFKKEILFDVLSSNDHEDFGRGIIPQCINKLKVAAYLFDGYWEDIGTIKAFFDAHMELIQPVPKFDFYDEEHPFYTHPRYLPPSKVYNCQIHRSLMAEGCILLGSIIENSIIGIRSFVEEGALIQNSIIMGNTRYETLETKEQNTRQNIPNLGIGHHCIIRNAIVDLDCRIGNNVHLINKDKKSYYDGDFYNIRDGIIVIPKNTVIPDNTIV
ncbi:glucose-1-phosphate adenylyltransferase [Caldithrix abyssi]|uniref:Glucose-1-phosphate adenylyltransferase n=1 Tax=Caldithrix abyssi DSM 13497 TaxID=880073 RepID=H1XRQ2_CALAY|nr:glucose-1-phosphate adenylyltransferase [Caldithrix abyssi]APF17121.1 glucose-1-phosphate adenylyltransferase [Caldithrix abyssi DSM 13497]EHO41262.1 Nucleotidyl transferase [Caldithrix abyssi DSM 13497]